MKRLSVKLVPECLKSHSLQTAMKSHDAFTRNTQEGHPISLFTDQLLGGETTIQKTTSL